MQALELPIILLEQNPDKLGSTVTELSVLLDRLDLIDEYQFLVHPRITGHGPTLYQSGLPSTRWLELISSTPLRNGADKDFTAAYASTSTRFRLGSLAPSKPIKS